MSGKILLFADDAALAHVTALRLELLGYGVEVASCEEGAIRALGGSQPDVVIVHAIGPEANDFELVAHLACESQSTPPPIVVFSGDNNRHLAKDAYLAGACAFVAMPYDSTALSEKLGQLMAR